MIKPIADTPLMRQYSRIKNQHPDAILLFRVGDFYETFSEDAIIASEILGITLTRRANGAAQYVELAGFPHHALDTYLPKLVRAGKRVAICDQLEDPKKTKKLVKRGITELVTPGVSINDTLLNHRENNFLCAIHFSKNMCGISLLDISTGEFLTSEGLVNDIDKLLASFSPKEILIERGKKKEFIEKFGDHFFLFELDDWVFTEESTNDRLLKHFQTKNLKGFGVSHLTLGLVASGTILHYLDVTHHTQIDHIISINRIEEDRYVRLDKFTVRSLELASTMNEEGKSLLDIIDKTISPMGSRMMRRWLMFPLKEKAPIEKRLEVVENFFRETELKTLVQSHVAQIGDLERIISKAAVRRITPREVAAIKTALTAIEPLRDAFLASENKSLQEMGEKLNPCPLIRDRIEKELIPDPPALINKGGFINDGVNEKLDELRNIAHSGRDYLLHIQKREIEKTSIPSLKIGFNNVFGYYIEVRHTHKDKVPKDWVRKQTLVSAERYITEELKEYEEKILGADEKIYALEIEIFNSLVESLIEYIPTIQINANIIAQCDCLYSFAKIAQENRYIRPKLDSSLEIDIKNGRHPVIEMQLPPDEPFIANDVYLDNDTQQIIIITGPNMSGKSALLRQTALITIMAQMGSFVPAESARIGLVDKIFTRVGASDNISLGESTFMVEMNEAANILNNLSTRSLILFDELGRGTSTYDGISIAWSIVEYIHENPKARAKTLFATHYHELNEMEKSFKRIKNFNISVKEIDNKIIFLRKLIPGGSEHSFGIHVAQMAGMPPSITHRAESILEEMEQHNRKKGISKPLKEIMENREGLQLSFFQLDDPILSQVRDEIINLDVNNLTPVDALNKLNEIKKIIRGK
ncbi:MAG TPA: DNA mismatch repair protein MutS [Dysgonamonadaceae bacterium]|nr:DNA mismatch repair protein MutS [Dysgonamonadaceae bacterium]